MSEVRVLVGTRKGAFVLTSDGKRERWDVSGPHFAGWEIYHLKGSPADPNRLYASQSSGWFGQVIQRSNDGGKTWEPVGNKFVYDGVPGTHQWYDGTPHPWEFKRVWHLEPSLTDPDTVYAGVEDAALFRSTDGGKTWQELPGLRGHGSGPHWQPGAGGMCLHTILLDPSDPERIFIAISAAGAFRTDDGGKTWRPINRGLKSEGIPDPECRGRPLRAPHRHAPVAPGRAVHAEALGRHAQRRRRRFVARGQRQPADRLRVPDRRARARAGDDLRRPDQERLGALSARGQAARLPQPDGRQRMGGAHEGPAAAATATSTCCATRWPSIRSTRAACISARPAARCTRRPTRATPGRRSSAIFRPCCRSRCRHCHDPSRAPGTSADAGARRRRGDARRRGAGDAARGPRRARGALSDAARHDPRSRHAAAPAVRAGSSPARRICRTSRRTRRCPTRSRPGASRSWSSGRWPADSPTTFTRRTHRSTGSGRALMVSLSNQALSAVLMDGLKTVLYRG